MSRSVCGVNFIYLDIRRRCCSVEVYGLDNVVLHFLFGKKLCVCNKRIFADDGVVFINILRTCGNRSVNKFSYNAFICKIEFADGIEIREAELSVIFNPRWKSCLCF